MLLKVCAPFRYFLSALKTGSSDKFQGGFSFWNEAKYTLYSFFMKETLTDAQLFSLP